MTIRHLPHKILLLVVIALAGVTCFAAESKAASNQTVSFEAHELLWDGVREPALDKIKALGVNNIRVLVYWHRFAPNSRSRIRPKFNASNPNRRYKWWPLDKLFYEAGKRKMKVMLTLTGPAPKWATRDKKDMITYPSAKEFGEFARAVGARYGKVADKWSIWNEPNNTQFLMPQKRNGAAISPVLYRNLYLSAVRGLGRARVPAKKVLFGELMPLGNLVPPLTFLRSAFCLNNQNQRVGRCPRIPMGGVAIHPYTNRSGPSYVPASQNHFTIASLSRVTSVLDAASRNGVIGQRMPMYITEFGFSTRPKTKPPKGKRCGLPYVSLQQQAEFLAIAERVAYSNPRVAMFSQYLLTDDKDGLFPTGLQAKDGRNKPSYYGFQVPLVAKNVSVRQTILWGLVRPATRATTVTVEYKDPGVAWRRLRNARTNSKRVWSFRTNRRQGRVYRVIWVGRGGKRIVGPAIRSY
jgi:hypothetical protein